MTSTGKLGYLDYLKAAWRQRVPVKGLGPLPVNQMALGALAVLGILNPGFLFLGAAAEILYLGLLSTHPRFQRLIEGQQRLVVEESNAVRIRRVVDRLLPASKQRFQHLKGQCLDILGLSRELSDGELVDLAELRSSGLNELVWIFLRLLSSKDLLTSTLERVDSVTLEREIESLRGRVAQAEEDSALRRALEGSLDIQTRRLENHQKAGTSLQVIEAELERIENQVQLVGEEAAIQGGPEQLSRRLDTVTSAISDTSRWMDEHAEILTDLGSEPWTADLAGVTSGSSLEGPER